MINCSVVGCQVEQEIARGGPGSCGQDQGCPKSDRPLLSGREKILDRKKKRRRAIGASGSSTHWSPIAGPSSLDAAEESADLPGDRACARVNIGHDRDNKPGIQEDVEVGVDAVKPAAVADDFSGWTFADPKPIAVVCSHVV